MKKYLKTGFLPIGISFLFMLFFINAAYGITYSTVTNGNWSSPATWDLNGVPPTAGDIPVTAIIYVRHTIAYDTGNPIKNRGEFRIQPFGLSTAKLTVPSGINVENFSTGTFYVINGSYFQCRFVGCNEGQPYSGNNPGAPIQSGTFKNIGGYVEIRNAQVEVAQDWTSESNGTRLMIDSCITTGQNFSVSGSGSIDTLTRMHISIGWHASGNFQLADGTMTFDSVRIQLAGTSGSFQLNSGTANGDIDYITLRNHVVPFTGSGEIFASASLTSSGVNLDAYCVSAPAKYIPNGKFVGTQTSDCSLVFFPAVCSTLGPTAASASIGGRVTSADGRGIGKAVVELSGGDLTQPILVRTGSFGYFTFEDLPVGHTYVVTVQAKGVVFSNPSRVITLEDNVTGIDFIAEGGDNLKRPNAFPKK